jgi:zinc ribbon protein
MTPSANTTPLSGPPAGGFCAACGAALSAGARFCHRCGTPVGQGAPVITPSAPVKSTNANTLPWAIAFVAVLAVVAYSAGQNFGKAKGSAVDGSSNSIANPAIDGPAAAAAAGRAPDISAMSPSERANRLYQRIMTLAENNKMDSAVMFTQMGIPAHEALENPTSDERFHLARLAEIASDSTIARAQSDTILINEPNNLLGLLMQSRAALMNGNAAKAKKFDQQLLKVLDAELAKGTQDYQLHRAEIDRAAADARKNN